MIHDATPSWSGYNYQGKLALHFALCHIHKNISSNPTHSFHGDSIVLENNEDFELFTGNQLTSFHQVKAYDKQSFSSYDEALFGLALNLYNQPGPNGYIHTWKAIRLPPQKNLQQAIQDFVIALTAEHRKKPKSSTISKAVNETKDRNKTAKIIKQAFKEHTSDQIYEILQTIIAEPSVSLARIQIYAYNGAACCSIDEINELIKLKLADINLLRGGTNSAKQIDNGFYNLLAMIDLYVTKRHLEKQANELLHIKISDILSIIDADYEDISENYLAIKFKERFFHLFDEYMSNPEYYSTPDNTEEFICNLSQIRNSLLPIAPHQLFTYYKNFSPYVRFEPLTPIEQALAVNENGITDVLLKAFDKLSFTCCEQDDKKSKLVYRSTKKPENHYLPTTINDRSIFNIARRLKANTRIIEDLFEINHMIYDGKQSISLEEKITEHTSAPPTNDLNPNRESQYFSNLRLISIQEAASELNAD